MYEFILSKVVYFSQKTYYSEHVKTMQNPLAKQDRIEQDFDGRLYLIRKVSKSKDFSIDFDEGGRSRIQILQARIWRKMRKRQLLGCSIRFCLAKWSNMWSFRFHVKNCCNKLKTTYPCTYSFVCR